ncbi:S8 family serine peptidase [Paenibacillus sp. CF384]|uniref:S8 family serine peptidase n=1 Tax=Paenibacillus sp. CF384 TaxID=1884382 RepID=UPI0008971CFE|nr:S8 family serine peptidase [Paenibacillus sp. CF384]SDW94935.1 Peptidase inhibitor I9 [Paenibacillus sp. CF384]
MHKSSRNKLVSKVIVGSMLVSLALPYNVFAANSLKDVSPSNFNLSPAQKSALKQLDFKRPVISPELDLKSSASVPVIIEFKQAPAQVEILKQSSKGVNISPNEALEEAEDDHATFKSYVQQLVEKKAAEQGPTTFEAEEVAITREYHHAFNGVAMTLPGKDIESLLRSGVVKTIYKDNVVQLDPKEMELLTGAEAAQQSDAPSTDNSIPLDGINDLHAQGIKGQGIKVGVLDTGIDYNHPDLTHAYKGYRAQEGVDPKTIDPSSVKGWDAIDNDADPMETTYKDWQASGETEDQGGGTYYTSHGTHVSGTIVGRAENTATDAPTLGVAPEADLYVYRVLGPYGSGTESQIMAGIDKAVQDGMDVINLSLGVMVNDPLMAEAVSINNATLLGVVCAVAAGNAGPDEKTVTSPGTSPLGITVGASDFAIALKTMTGSVSDASGSISLDEMHVIAYNYSSMEGLLNTEQPFEIVDVGLADTADFEGKDLTGKVAFIQRGTLSLQIKVENAAKAGAIAAIMSNNVDGDIPFVGDGSALIPTFGTSQANGEALKGMAAPKVSFSSMGSTVTEGGHLAGFSGVGPVNGSYDIKPDVVGPGVNVYSTYPEYIHSKEEGIDYSHAYARISGTSMATPHVAGIIALILQQHPDYTPFDVRAALMNTADDLNGDYSVYQVGAGEVDVTEAVNADVSIQVLNRVQTLDQDGNSLMIDNPTGSISYGNHAKFSDIGESRSMTITNTSAADKTFTIAAEFFAGGSVNAVDNDVTINVGGSESVMVPAGESVTLPVTVVVPLTAANGRYEGYVHFTNAENADEKYQVPFAIRVVEPGIDSMYLTNPAFMTEFPSVINENQGRPNFIALQLNSPMKTLETSILDKDGYPIGNFFAVTSFDASEIPVDELTWNQVEPIMYPYIGDPADNQLSSQAEIIKEGEYTLRMITKDAEGRSFTKDTMFIIDNKRPVLTFNDYAPGVYEVDDSMFTTEELQGTSHSAIWIHANLFDEGTAKLAPIGITQSANRLFYYQDQISVADYEFLVEANGDVKFGVTRDDLIDPVTKKDKPMTLTLFPIDLATNGYLIADFQHYGFIKAGSPYVVPDYDRDRVALGDEITMTLNLNNVEDLIAGKYDVSYYKFFEFVDVKVNDAFKARADDAGVTVKLDEPILKGDPEWTSKDLVTVGASLKGQTEGFDGDMPFLNVTFKMVDDKNFTGLDKMNIEQNIEQFYYKKAGEEADTEIPVFNQINSYKVFPKHSIVEGDIYPEAFMTFSGDYGDLNRPKDYSIIGARISANVDGKSYKGTIATNGRFTFDNLPLSENEIEFTTVIPGHLTSHASVKIGKKMFDEPVGMNAVINNALNLAGDVNGDHMIDILDAQLVAAQAYKRSDTNFPAEDLNQDGLVDAKDLALIDKNFMEVDSEATGSPQETVDGKGVQDFIDELAATTPISDLTNKAFAQYEAEFEWSAVTGASAISIDQSSNDGVTWKAAKTTEPLTLNATSAKITGLQAGKAHKFRIVVTGGPNAGISNIVDVTTEAGPLIDFMSTAVTETEADFRWSPASEATELVIEQSTDNGESWTKSDTTEWIAPDVATAKVTGLTAGTAYQFRLVVTGGTNEGASNIVKVTTPAQYVPGGPGVPIPPDNTVTEGDNGIVLTPGAGEIKSGTTPDGKTVVTVTPNADTLAKAFETLKGDDAKKQTIVIRVDQAADNVGLDLPASVLADAAASNPNAVITVETDNGSFNLPISTVDYKGLTKSLGSELSEMTVTISMTAPTTEQEQQIADSAKANNLNVVGVVNFTVTATAGGKSEEITNFGSTYVTRTIVVEGQGEGKQFMAVLIDPVTGEMSFIPATVKNNNGTVEAVIYAPHASFYGIVEVSPKTFADVTAHWAKKEIELLASALLVKGTSASTFSPSSTVSRAEFAAMLARALGLEMADTATAFADVPADKWYASAVHAIVEAGIVSGRSKDSFAPNATITREEMAVMLAGALKLAGKSSSVSKQLSFTDKGSIAGWAQAAVTQATDAGILQGNNKGAFAPKANATRAEAAVVLKRWLQFVGFMN